MVDTQTLLFSVLFNAAATAAIGAFILWWLKTWLGRKIDSSFKLLEEAALVKLEIEKTQALNMLGRRNTVYPEILEVTYRVRNMARDVVAIFPSEVKAWDLGAGKTRENVEKMKDFESVLYMLTENLYKYRAFVDEEVFDMLHRLKRNLQDASVVMDRLMRPIERGKNRYYVATNPAEDAAIIYGTLINKLRELYTDSDKLYHDITVLIKASLERSSLLERRRE